MQAEETTEQIEEEHELGDSVITPQTKANTSYSLSALPYSLVNKMMKFSLDSSSSSEEGQCSDSSDEEFKQKPVSKSILNLNLNQ